MSLILKILKTLLYQVAFAKLRRKGVLFYLKTLQAIRKSLALALVLFFTLQIMVFGFMGALVSGVFLLPIEDHSTRLWILFSVSSLFFILPFSLICILLSEKAWFKASGAEQLLQPETHQDAA